MQNLATFSTFSSQGQAQSISVGGLPYMTSAVDGGGGPQKADERNKTSWFVTVTRGEGVKISENLADVIYGSPLSDILSAYIGHGRRKRAWEFVLRFSPLQYSGRGRLTQWRNAFRKASSAHILTLRKSLGLQLWIADFDTKLWFISIAYKKSQVKQCLGFSTADFWSMLAYESAE